MNRGKMQQFHDPSRKIVAIIQARTTSTRFPEKVMQNIAGKPMLMRVIERVQRSSLLDLVTVATSTESSDDRIDAFCLDHLIPCYRGSLGDVLDRYYQAARTWHATIVVRICSDCPLIDPDVVDNVIASCIAKENEVDYCTNSLPTRTYPIGLDVEAVPFRILELIWNVDKNPLWREHVTQYIVKHQEQFSIRCVRHDSDLSHHRWTVDTPEDMDLVRRIYSILGDQPFSWNRVLEVIEEHPEWKALNIHVLQKTV